MIDNLIIEATNDTPGVRFAPSEDVFFIGNKSLPEDALSFYKPIQLWIEEYMQTPNDKTVFEFKFEYFNTASAKQIGKVLLLLKKLRETSQVVVRWFSEEEDLAMLQAGKRYEKLIDLPFEYVVFTPED
ncbi:MAG TPA: nuclear pore complex subunit [Bacteroidales bacterium]|nr:nuclear pore complex subunit [Bacteroidales bacterium]